MLFLRVHGLWHFGSRVIWSWITAARPTLVWFSPATCSLLSALGLVNTFGGNTDGPTFLLVDNTHKTATFEIANNARICNLDLFKEPFFLINISKSGWYQHDWLKIVFLICTTVTALYNMLKPESRSHIRVHISANICSILIIISTLYYWLMTMLQCETNSMSLFYFRF